MNKYKWNNNQNYKIRINNKIKILVMKKLILKNRI